MGQAKKRGSVDQRIAEAKARERAKFPPTVACNNCQAQLADIEPMDVRGMQGLRAAGAARCEACDSVTWVIDGTPEAMASVAQYLENQSGTGPGQIGFVPRPSA